MKNTSYILNNQNSELTKFTLDEINKCTYFKTSTLSKHYINDILKIGYRNIKNKIRLSTSNKIGKIISELYKLGAIKKHTEGARTVWKNLYKNQLHTALNEKMEQNYHIIKIKKG